MGESPRTEYYAPAAYEALGKRPPLSRPFNRSWCPLARGSGLGSCLFELPFQAFDLPGNRPHQSKTLRAEAS